MAKKTIDTLMRGLLEADHELLEAERRTKRMSEIPRRIVGSSVHDESRKLSETFMTQHLRAGSLPGTSTYDLQTDRGKGSSSLRISKSKR